MTKKESMLALAYVAFGMAIGLTAMGLYYFLKEGHGPALHIVYLLPVGLTVFGLVTQALLNANPLQLAAVKRQYGPRSYLHPDNHPKGRIKAPNGTSD